MAYYLTRNDVMTQAVDTFAPVETGADGGTAGAIRVPAGTSKITCVNVSLSASIVAVASSGGVVTVRLAGPGLKDGQQELTAGGIREDTTSTAGFKTHGPVVLPVDIKVIPGNDINIAAAISGVDPGSPNIGVTLCIE